MALSTIMQHSDSLKVGEQVGRIYAMCAGRELEGSLGFYVLLKVLLKKGIVKYLDCSTHLFMGLVRTHQAVDDRRTDDNRQTDDNRTEIVRICSSIISGETDLGETKRIFINLQQALRLILDRHPQSYFDLSHFPYPLLSKQGQAVAALRPTLLTALCEALHPTHKLSLPFVRLFSATISHCKVMAAHEYRTALTSIKSAIEHIYLSALGSLNRGGSTTEVEMARALLQV